MAGVREHEVDGRTIAYRLRTGRSPALVFLPGYASDMEGAKAQALDAYAADQGIGMLRFDYSGTGVSPGAFEDGTLERWTDEAEAMSDLVEGPVIVVGSSMGGWIGLHVALRRPEKVVGFLGIAAAPDFTQWGYGEEEKRILASEGRLEQPNPYGDAPQVTTLGFWESAQELRLLEEPIDLACPVRLVHGDEDEDVPLEIAFRLKDRLRSEDVQLTIVKGGGHRLSGPKEIDTIVRRVSELIGD